VIGLLADENFNNNIVRGVRLRDPDIDLVRVQDVGLSGRMIQRCWSGRPNSTESS
jgi:hypothetical protein